MITKTPEGAQENQMTETATPSADPIVPPATATVGQAPYSAAYTRYAMLLLLAIYTINFLDRSIINILAEPIKNELKLADWQLGLMSGLAFALFYTILGIPLAQLAERRNRPMIIGASVAVWSGFTALSGATTNFVQLVLCRIGVGIGEAGCTPPAHSLIADYVPKEKRASALAFYSMGTPLGGLLGLVMGGLIADAYGWRVAFLVAGVPGLLFAALCFLTLREPRKILAEHSARITSAQALGAAIKAFIGYGHAPFTASFFLRVHGEEVARLASMFELKSVGFMGLALGLMGGTAGMISAWLGGQIADRFAKTDLRGYVVVPAIASLIAVPVYIIAVSVPSASVALWILVINGLLGSLWYGPVYAIGQSIVPAHMRATTSAILLFVINLIGLGLGPTVVGIISDVMANGVGLGSAQGVRWALMISTCFGVLAFLLFWMARKTIREEMES